MVYSIVGKEIGEAHDGAHPYQIEQMRNNWSNI